MSFVLSNYVITIGFYYLEGRSPFFAKKKAIALLKKGRSPFFGMMGAKKGDLPFWKRAIALFF
jgi:hypothetical protein